MLESRDGTHASVSFSLIRLCQRNDRDAVITLPLPTLPPPPHPRAGGIRPRPLRHSASASAAHAAVTVSTMLVCARIANVPRYSPFWPAHLHHVHVPAMPLRP